MILRRLKLADERLEQDKIKIFRDLGFLSARKMADSTRRRYSGSPPYEAPSRSRSRSRSRSWSRPRGRPVSRSRSRSRGRDEAINPGNTLHVTGLSTRVTQEQLEEHFSKEGKVSNCFLVVEPRSRISRGFAFITMETLEDANRCIKHLNQSVLEHRQITVERHIKVDEFMINATLKQLVQWPS
ncbi:hypothetical protein L6452_37998 [Arctium lappa]|uniref:Uncharacterized protein n=1 Tax=Arctium lappa TaxID=4217 RepID=A0ACB8Y4J1_ARCLA|nr:hypothetical protein L6452_37998 [Arctium lappa]